MQKTFNILLVDDEENVLKALKRLFIEDEGLEVHTASSGREGLELLKNTEFAVIVSDQRMPEMTGVEFLQQAKELFPDAVRIMLTGYADIHATIKAINDAGAYRYITKPWNDKEIKFIIKEALDYFRLIKENKYLLALTVKQKEELNTWSKKLENHVRKQIADLTEKDSEINILNSKLQKYHSGILDVLKKGSSI